MKENILAEVLRERCRGMVDTCEGHHNDNLIDCSKCPKFPKGLEEREKQRQIEKNTRIGFIALNDGNKEIQIFRKDEGLSYRIVLGKTVEDQPRPNILLIEQEMELDLESIRALVDLLREKGGGLLCKKKQ
ncbi:MAG: hypothetical protein L6275_04590 [Candidatus Portnoybacteria bacterium]|nr:hypothetical protein [Candidatus Portnoybacteria bacterium]